MRQLKKYTVFEGFGLISLKLFDRFPQTYVSFRKSYIEVFEIKRLGLGHSLLSWELINQGVLG